MSNILDKIRTDFTEFSRRNKYIQELIKKLEDGKATLSEVDAITKATGYALKVAFEKNIAENAAAFADEKVLTEILRETFGDNYEMINSIAADVQQRMDKSAGINIKPQKAGFPTERVDNLAKFTSGKDLTDEKALSEFGASVENINNSMFTDYVKANAEFRSRAGLKVYVIRSDGAGCCEWCSNLVGKYVYPDVPKDVWRRHKRCSCEITYVNEKVGTYDRISYSDRKDGEKLVSNKQVTRLTPEQAAAKEKDVLNRLDKRRKSGIIRAGSDDVAEIIKLGKLNPQPLENEFGKLKTDELIVTDERIEHIKFRHPEDFELFEKYGLSVVEEPDFIIKDEKNENTVFMTKKLENTNLNLVVKIILETDEKDLKNSVMTFYRIREKNLKKLMNKNKTLYKKE